MNRAIAIGVLTVTGLAAWLAVGCGSDDNKPAGNQGTVNQGQAKTSSVSMTKGISNAVDKNDGQGSLNALVQGSQEARSIVSPAAGAKPQGIPGIVTGLRTTGTCACEGTKCTYTDCTPTGGAGGSGVVINGSLSWEAGNLKCVGLKYEISSASTKTTITLDCDVKVTASSINGYVKSSGSSSLGGLLADAGVNVNVGDVSWTSNTVFKDVKYANGTPTSGSVHVDATTTVAGQTYNGSADINFP